MIEIEKKKAGRSLFFVCFSVYEASLLNTKKVNLLIFHILFTLFILLP